MKRILAFPMASSPVALSLHFLDHKLSLWPEKPSQRSDW